MSGFTRALARGMQPPIRRPAALPPRASDCPVDHSRQTVPQLGQLWTLMLGVRLILGCGALANCSLTGESTCNGTTDPASAITAFLFSNNVSILLIVEFSRFHSEANALIEAADVQFNNATKEQVSSGRSGLNFFRSPQRKRARNRKGLPSFPAHVVQARMARHHGRIRRAELLRRADESIFILFILKPR